MKIRRYSDLPSDYPDQLLSCAGGIVGFWLIQSCRCGRNGAVRLGDCGHNNSIVQCVYQFFLVAEKQVSHTSQVLTRA